MVENKKYFFKPDRVFSLYFFTQNPSNVSEKCGDLYNPELDLKINEFYHFQYLYCYCNHGSLKDFVDEQRRLIIMVHPETLNFMIFI